VGRSRVLNHVHLRLPRSKNSIFSGGVAGNFRMLRLLPMTRFFIHLRLRACLPESLAQLTTDNDKAVTVKDGFCKPFIRATR
jgi:hypothetical protein